MCLKAFLVRRLSFPFLYLLQDISSQTIESQLFPLLVFKDIYCLYKKRLLTVCANSLFSYSAGYQSVYQYDFIGQSLYTLCIEP